MKTIIIKETADNSFSDSDMVRMLDHSARTSRPTISCLSP